MTIFSLKIQRETFLNVISIEQDADNKISGFSLVRLLLVYRLKRLEVLN